MSRIAKRYAKALFELAVEDKKLADVHGDLQHIENVIRESEDFRKFLSDPLLNEELRLKTLKSIFEGKVSSPTLNFMKLVSEKQRLFYLDMMIGNFNQMYLAHHNQVEGELISAVELQADQVDRIKSKVEKATGKEVLLKQTLQPHVIGGFIVKIGDTVIDNSIRFQLNKLRERLKTR